MIEQKPKQKPMKLNYIRNKIYSFYNPLFVIRSLYLYQQKLNEQEDPTVGVAYRIRNNEYRQFLRYGRTTQNINRILNYYYSHGLQKDKNKSISFEKGKHLLPTEQLNFLERFMRIQTDLQTKKDTQIYDIDIFHENKKPKPYIKIHSQYGIYWITLRKKVFRKQMLIQSPYVYNSIILEFEKLLTSQLKITDKINQDFLKKDKTKNRYNKNE